MACVSYWAYKTVKRATQVRARLLLAYASAKLDQPVESFRQLLQRFLDGGVPKAVFEFVMNNRMVGVVTCRERMAEAVALYFHVQVHINGAVVARPTERLGYLFMGYRKQKFILRIPHGVLPINDTATLKLLAESGSANEWIEVGTMRRTNAIHAIRTPHDCLHTVARIDSYRQTEALFVYGRVGDDTCELLAQCDKDGFNPYFVLDAPTEIFVVECEDREKADKLLQIENKLTVI